MEESPLEKLAMEKKRSLTQQQTEAVIKATEAETQKQLAYETFDPQFKSLMNEYYKKVKSLGVDPNCQITLVYRVPSWFDGYKQKEEVLNGWFICSARGGYTSGAGPGEDYDYHHLILLTDGSIATYINTSEKFYYKSMTGSDRDNSKLGIGTRLLNGVTSFEPNEYLPRVSINDANHLVPLRTVSEVDPKLNEIIDNLSDTLVPYI